VGGESDVSLPLVGPEPLATGGRADNDRHLDETVNRERSPNDFAELDRHNSARRGITAPTATLRRDYTRLDRRYFELLRHRYRHCPQRAESKKNWELHYRL
jgi:hypothetical protein